MPDTFNPFSGDFWTEENWFGSKGQKPWQTTPRMGAYGTGTAGANMQQLLQQQARGEGPSLGRGMMEQGLQQAIKNQRAQAAGMMGTNPALAQKLSGEQAGQMTAQNLRDVGQVGLQEQMQAQQALQNWIQQERAAQMMAEQERLRQQNIYQQRMLGYDPATQGIFGDVMGAAGAGLGFALGGPMGGAAGGAIGRGLGGGGDMGRSGVPYSDYRNPNWGF
jgi:hypothetical protein